MSVYALGGIIFLIGDQGKSINDDDVKLSFNCGYGSLIMSILCQVLSLNSRNKLSTRLR